MVGLIKPLDAGERGFERERAAVNLLLVVDDARDRAEPANGAQRLAVDEIGQAAVEKKGVELIRLAIDVDVGSGKMRVHQHGAMLRRGGQEFLHIGVLGFAQRLRRKPGGLHKARRGRPGRYAGN